MIRTVFLPKLPDIKESTPEMHYRLCTKEEGVSLVLLKINRSILMKRINNFIHEIWPQKEKAPL